MEKYYLKKRKKGKLNILYDGDFVSVILNCGSVQRSRHKGAQLRYCGVGDIKKGQKSPAGNALVPSLTWVGAAVGYEMAVLTTFTFCNITIRKNSSNKRSIAFFNIRGKSLLISWVTTFLLD